MRMRISALLALIVCLGACSRTEPVCAGQEAVTAVGVTSVTRKPMMRQLTVSSELDQPRFRPPRTEEKLAEFEETSYSRARLGNATLKGKHLPRRVQYRILQVPSFPDLLVQSEPYWGKTRSVTFHTPCGTARRQARAFPPRASW
jgi:hypothetical protein